jgi:hypothetical protein
MKKWFYILGLLTVANAALGQQCFSGDCMNGYGIQHHADGSRYLGEFKDGQRNGQGTLIEKSGQKHVGTWVEGYRTGEGRTYQNDKLLQSGIWKNNVLTTVSYEKNGCLSGDCRQGYGIYLSQNGTKTIGSFQNGSIEGFGVAYYADGGKYVGEWKNGQRNGRGTNFNPSGVIDEGVWDNNTFVGSTRNIGLRGCIKGNCDSGTGVYLYPDNTYYEGNFKGDKADGFGVCHYPDGDIYVGEWQNHAFNGYGTMLYNNGLILKGIWKNGFFVQISEEESTNGHVEFDIEEIKTKSKVWAVIVGVSRYSSMPSLKYTDDDAFKIHAFFKGPEGGALPDAQVKLLIDEEATRKHILDGFRDMAAKAGENDVLLFYFSGHGIKGAFLPQDFDGKHFVVQHSDLMEIMEKSRAKSKIIIADACHSGSFGIKGQGYEQTLDNFYDAFDKSEGGTVMLLSSKAEETSVESNGLRQGIFSHFLIRGLKGSANMNGDKIVTVSELFTYVSENVRFYTNGVQNPVVFGSYDVNMPLGAVRD